MKLLGRKWELLTKEIEKSNREMQIHDNGKSRMEYTWDQNKNTPTRCPGWR